MPLRADPDEIRAVAKQQSAQADELWDEVVKLSQKMVDLTDSGWLGTAATSHASAWARWVDSAKQVAAALSQDSMLLNQAANNYTTQEDAQANRLAALNL